MFCVFTGGSFFTVRTTIVSRLSLSLSLCASTVCRRVGRLRQLILLYLPSHLDYGVRIALLTHNISH